jgi:polyisoprenoid-binding protein YceI
MTDSEQSPTADAATGTAGPSATATALPAGRWEVDPAQSRVAFTVRAMWGLVPVKGHFERYSGSLEVDASGSRGSLEIDSASLDTKQSKRDAHLRSADFFGADEHPSVTFTINAVSPNGDGLSIDGDLVIKGTPLHLRLPVTVGGDGVSQLKLTTATTVERHAVGMGWNRVGMISGPAKLEVELVLEPAR